MRRVPGESRPGGRLSLDQRPDDAMLFEPSADRLRGNSDPAAFFRAVAAKLANTRAEGDGFTFRDCAEEPALLAAVPRVAPALDLAR